MATRAPEHHTSAGEFWLALSVAFVTMIVVAVGTLYALGYLSAGRGSGDVAYTTSQTVTSDSLTPAAKPTAVWKFRAEWQKPAQP